MPTYTRADGRGCGARCSTATGGGACGAARLADWNAITWCRCIAAAPSMTPQTCNHFVGIAIYPKPHRRTRNPIRPAMRGESWSES